VTQSVAKVKGDLPGHEIGAAGGLGYGHKAQGANRSDKPSRLDAWEFGDERRSQRGDRSAGGGEKLGAA
jgi:hypothetical protein